MKNNNPKIILAFFSILVGMLIASQIKLQVDLNGKTRQIVSGIAQYYECEDLVGKTVIVITNLKPAMLRGELSEGMLLAASNSDKLSLVTVDKEMPSGCGVS